MLEAKGILLRRMAGETPAQDCAPTILAVQRRNNCPAQHPYERRQSYGSFSLEIGRPGQPTYWSPGHPEMPRERAKSGVWWPGLSKQIEDLVKVHLTPKYFFFCLNKSLHKFETYCAVLRLFQPNIDIFIGYKSYEI